MPGTGERLTEAYEEWRLVFDVPVHVEGLDAVVHETRSAAPPDVDVHRRDRGDIAVYATSERAVEGAREIVESGLSKFGIPFSSELKRWNPGEERWQDPALPVDPPKRRLEPDWLALGDVAWEVRMRLETRAEASRLAAGLREEGLAVITDGWRRLTVGVADEQAARDLANDLRLRAGAFAAIEARPLSRWRRWLIRQGLLGNYGDGGGGGEGGGGGNGGGG